MIIINVLGKDYKIIKRKRRNGEYFEGDWWHIYLRKKQIVIDNTKESNQKVTSENLDGYINSILRKVIVRVFMYESGFDTCGDWVAEIVIAKWFGKYGEAIYNAWKDAGVI